MNDKIEIEKKDIELLNKNFIEAVKTNDIELVCKLIRDGVDIHLKDDFAFKYGAEHNKELLLILYQWCIKYHGKCGGNMVEIENLMELCGI